MECGEYPDCLNISQIVPIPKCSSPSIPSQYRPKSILPTAPKMTGGHFGSEAKVLLRNVELAQRKAVRHQAWLCTENDNSSYRNVCKMSVVSFALAVMFIIRLFSTSVFRVPKCGNANKKLNIYARVLRSR